MRREAGKLADGTYDLLVVGAGIYGACVARDASLRGMRVALIDRGDFGGETSHNSLKIIHGGLRYLQHLDVVRVRQSVAERRFWLRAAPHLVRPLQFVIPVYGFGSRGAEALWAAMRVHELIGVDRNAGVANDRHIPRGRLVSREECRALLPRLPGEGLRGAAVWYDGQMEEADRALLGCVVDAVAHGAAAANYVSAVGFLRRGERVTGVEARDELSGEAFAIRAALTINTSGPWISGLLCDGALALPRMSGLARGMNLVTRRLLDGYAAGVRSRRASDAVVGTGERLFFITPWRDKSVIGTSHLPHSAGPDDEGAWEEDVEQLIAEFNEAYPAAELRREDVEYCYAGKTPALPGTRREQARRGRHPEVIDHARCDGVSGLISVVGVKYTTARLVAERVVDLAGVHLGRRFGACVSHKQPLPGGVGYEGMEALLADARRQVGGGVEDGVLRRLVGSYGTGYRPIWGVGGDDACVAGTRTLRRACRYAVGQEMAVRLGDVVFRRTNLAALDGVGEAGLQWCARMMAESLGWDDAKRERELDAVRARLGRHRGVRDGAAMVR